MRDGVGALGREIPGTRKIASRRRKNVKSESKPPQKGSRGQAPMFERVNFNFFLPLKIFIWKLHPVTSETCLSPGLGGGGDACPRVRGMSRPRLETIVLNGVHGTSKVLNPQPKAHLSRSGGEGT